MKIRINHIGFAGCILLVTTLFLKYLIQGSSHQVDKLANANETFQDKLPFKKKSDRTRLERREKNQVASMNDNKQILYTNGREITDVTVSFKSDLSIVISPALKNTSKLLSEADLFIYDQMRPETCGEFIGVELVAGDGTYLTNKNPDYQGVFHNRDSSRITVPMVGIGYEPFPSTVPEVRISIINLISRLKLELSSDDTIKLIAMDGLRFRIRFGLPGYSIDDKLISNWIYVDKLGRENLISYLESKIPYEISGSLGQ